MAKFRCLGICGLCGSSRAALSLLLISLAAAQATPRPAADRQSGSSRTGAAPTRDSAPGIFPLREVRAGMTGYGETVFSGDQPQRFAVKILGVVDNMGPKQAVILAQLSGGPLAETGVLEGMSGSPVYLDGRLVGAVALGFTFAKTPIAGITPIEQMLAQQKQGELIAAAEKSQAGPRADQELMRNFQGSGANGGAQGEDQRDGGWRLVSPPATNGMGAAASAPALAGASAAPLPMVAQSATPPSSRLSPLAGIGLPELRTPLVLAGVGPATLQKFLPRLEALGLMPVLGGSSDPAASGLGGEAPPATRVGSPSPLQPGDMISVQLMRGDVEVSAQGTVTYVHDGRILAFGHRFLAAGATDLPFARAKVVALMPGYMSSFKIAVSGERLGVIRQDRSLGVYGVLGGEAPMIPVRIRLLAPGAPPRVFQFQMVNDRYLTPLLFNLGVASTLDAEERGVGAATLALRGAIHLGGAPDVAIRSLFSGDANAPTAAALAAARPLSELYASGIGPVPVRGIDLDVTATDQLRWLRLEQVWSDRRVVAPGETFRVTALLRAPDGSELARTIPVQLPASVSPGPLRVFVGDGAALDAQDARLREQALNSPGLAPLAAAINEARRDDRLYLRVTQQRPAFAVAGRPLPAPPPSLARALRARPAADTEVAPLFASPLADYVSRDLGFVVRGAKTIVVQVRP